MYILAKIATLLTQPLTLLIVFLAIAVIFRAWKCVRALVAIMVVLAFVPIGPFLLHKLERQFPVVTLAELDRNNKDIAGVIILGGAVDLETSIRAGQPQLSAAVERFVEGIALANHYPDKIVIFTCGSASTNNPEMNEAEQTKILMQKLNIDPERFVFEGKSRNTFENMNELEGKGYKERGRWILLTSAYHMPRSVMLFQTHNWKIIPYPANYMEDDDFNWFSMPNILGNYMKLGIVTREIMGIMTYKFLGRIS